jgi:DUF1680 family protein
VDDEVILLNKNYLLMKNSSFEGLIVTSIIIAAITCSMIFNTGHTFLEKDKWPLAFSNKDVKLYDSWIKERETLNTNYIYQLDPERLLHNFRVNAGIKSDAKPLEGWEAPNIGLRGHFTGHYLSACASLIEKNGDTLLLKRINYMVDALWDCQQKLGGKYLSAFPENDFTTLETRISGVWAPYYTYHKIMQGLLDVYTLTGNKKAYTMVLNMADYVKQRMDKLSPEVIEKMLYTVAANPGNEPGGMNDVLHNLYAVSKDPEHLKLASLFDRKWFSQPLYEGKDILPGLHSNTHLPLIIGFAKRYETTSETYYREVTANFWDILINHHTYVNGSSSGPRPVKTTPTSRTAEHWGIPDSLSTTLTSEIAESCVSHNTQKITGTLFRWTAQPEYADVYMNTFYNAVMALQNCENGTCVYHLPLSSPQIKKFLKETDFRCCNGSAIEAFTHLNSNIYFWNNNNFWVNLYIPSEVKWKAKEITISQTGNFPSNSTVQFTVSTKKSSRFALNLFVPSWATNQTKVLINGKAVSVESKPLSYITLDRAWINGDKIELIFDYKFYLKTMSDNQNMLAIYYGPILLAFETDKELLLKGDCTVILNSIIKPGNDMIFTLKNGSTEYKLLPFYEVTNESYGVYAFCSTSAGGN